MTARRRNSISGQFSPRLIEMLESPAFRVLSLSAHRIISRIEIELAQHGGHDNGKLPVTKQDFIDYGVHHDGIAPAIREAEALGFIRVIEHGRGGNSEHRRPNLFRLTFAHDRNSRREPPTHDWRKIKTLAEAMEIAQAARAAKSEIAVFMGRRAAQIAAKNNRNRSRKSGPKPVPEIRTENPDLPVLETRTTGSVRKPGPLSISRGGGRMRPKSTNGNLPMDGVARLVLARPGPPAWPQTLKSNCRYDSAFGVWNARAAPCRPQAISPKIRTEIQDHDERAEDSGQHDS
jgi:hypothetical protein